jgi:hypothetical protein
MAAVTANATRVMEQPERPYEVSLAQVTLPSTTTGGLSVKPCEGCSYSTHVLTSATTFFVNNQAVPYAEFSRITAEIRGSRRESVQVNVFVDVDSGRVTRVKLRDRSLN